MKWGLLLHIYQPPGQRLDTIDLVVKESYEPLLDLLLNSDAPVTLNVTATLLEQLVNNDRWSVIDKLRTLYYKPNISFTNSAYSHALLPLWPDEEIVHQIKKDQIVLQEIINKEAPLKGLYLPECAYAKSIDGLARKTGHEWVLLDEISLVRQKYLPNGTKSGTSLKFLFRHRELSKALPTSIELFEEELHQIDGPAIVALDGEAFGHFDSRSINILRTVLDKYKTEMVSLDYLAKEAKEKVVTRAGTWETSVQDLQKQIPYPLWQDKHNLLHRQMWSYYKIIHQELHKSKGLDKNEWVRIHFDNAMSSCWWWWANTKRTAGPFKMSAWNPDIIVIGLSESIKAVRSDAGISAKVKWRIETLHADLLKLVWQTHWKLNS